MFNLVDDLGKPIRLASTRALRRRAGTEGYLSRDAYARVLRVTRVRGGLLRPGLIAIVLASVMLLLGGLWALPQAGQTAAILVATVCWACVVGLAGFLLRLLGSDQPAWPVSRALVAEGVCGACGYAVIALRPDERGLITCPECQAHWRASRLGVTADDLANRPGTSIEDAKRRGLSGRLSTDDRNRLVPIVDRRLRCVSAERKASLGEAIEPLAEKLSFVGAGIRLLTSVVICVPGMFAVLGVLSRPFDELNWQMALVLIVLAAILTLAVGVIMRSDLGASPRSIAFLVLCEQRCPTCLEDCRDVPLASDGRVECPVCGSAWRRLSRPTQRHTAGAAQAQTPEAE